MSTHQLADLDCEACGRHTEHELRYAGRLLDSTTCTECGHRVVMTPRAMLPAYARDLEQRLLSKPIRMARRFAGDPLGYSLGLPRAILRQPAKLLAELRELVRR